MKRIVVGIDGSPGATAALRWAVELAAATGAELQAVTAWQFPYGWVDGYPPDVERWAQHAEELARNTVEAAVAAATPADPASLSRVVIEGPAAKSLITQAKGADLLVVGTRGRGGFAGLLLGSVSHQCVEHATVPVAVVPCVDEAGSCGDTDDPR